jgi:sterol desaturase/sphingolipid hydroxylase (fatty acid hydroxylase superfamily)
MSSLLVLVALTSLFLFVAGLERVPVLRSAPAAFRRPYLGSDMAWYAAATAANATAAFLILRPLAALALPGTATRWTGMPTPARVAVALVLYDGVAYAVHRGLHRSSRLWALHKVHHSSRQLDWLATTRAHPLENLLRHGAAQAPLFLLGLPAATIAATVALYAAFALYGHSNLRSPRRLEALFVTPRLHRLHHHTATTDRNFGTVLTAWDRLAGTYTSDPPARGDRLGVPNEVDTYPQHLTEAFRQPLRELRARQLLARPATDGAGRTRRPAPGDSPGSISRRP